VWITLLVAWQSSLPENANMTPTAAAGPITAAAPTSTAEKQAKTASRRAGHVAPLRYRRLTGSVLNQATLAKTIGISTTRLREALRRLKVEGLVQLDAHRDAHVADLTAEEARDMLDVRRALDPAGAALAAQRRTKAEIAVIRASREGLEPLPVNATLDHLTRHRHFHASIYRASHNDLLIRSLDELWDEADRYRLLALQVDWGEGVREQKRVEHQQLMEAVIAGDANEASAVVLAHIETSRGVQAAWRLRKPARPASTP
jgi:DNA-binding GntR family transcriptional regulator